MPEPPTPTDLTGALGTALGSNAYSFQLMGEELALLDASALRSVADAWSERVQRQVPPALREAFYAAHGAILGEAHAWLRRYNHSLHSRIAGYVALGERLGFAYPWPVVAILGLHQVTRTLAQTSLMGAVTTWGERAIEAASRLARQMDRSADLMRRTNRSIFADSVPITLYAARCHELRERGRPELAAALLAAPGGLTFDDHGVDVARRLYALLGEPPSDERFDRLAALTLHQFDREQRIFTHHLLLGSDPARESRAPRPPSRLARALGAGSIHAPVVVSGELRFVRRPLPEGFQIRDHEARVAFFGDAFVRSVTRSTADYAAATRWVRERHGA